MASALTYRGGSAAPGSASNGGEYSPKPSKPLSWLSRAARYAAAEHRPVFALTGMLFAAALFTFSSHSTSSPSEPAAPVGFNHLAVTGHPSFRESVGGKVPLGLRRRALRVLVTGGAGFVGSHLVDRLVERGDSVIVVDNFFTGHKENLAHQAGHPALEVIRHDVVEPILLEVDQIDLPPGVSGVARALQAQPREDDQDQRDGHAQHAGPRQARQRQVPAHQHQRGVRRPAAAPAGGDLLGKRQPHRYVRPRQWPG